MERWYCVLDSINPCPDALSGLGSFVLFAVTLALACWLLFLGARLIWIAHTYSPWQQQNTAHKIAERLLEVHLKHGHGGAGLYDTLPPPYKPIDADATARAHSRITGEGRRIDALAADLQALKDKLGDPDNGLECEAVPCTGRKRGRWLKAWVPFWP